MGRRDPRLAEGAFNDGGRAAFPCRQVRTASPEGDLSERVNELLRRGHLILSELNSPPELSVDFWMEAVSSPPGLSFQQFDTGKYFGGGAPL